MSPFHSALIAVATVIVAPSLTARADIYRWDTGEVIPGTKGIEPGPGVHLGFINLEFAELSDIDLSDSIFWGANLTSARLAKSNLSGARFSDCLVGGNLSSADLSDTILTGAGLDCATLQNARFDNAWIEGAGFSLSDLSFNQLLSTRGYRERNLRGIGLGSFIGGPPVNLREWSFQDIDVSGAFFNGSDLTGADFTGADLTSTTFQFASVTNASFEDAIVSGADWNASNLSHAQLAASASYRGGNLRDIRLGQMDLTGWDFSSQDLSNAGFVLARLGEARFTGAVIDGADLSQATYFGFTSSQLYSTASYQEHHLRGIRFVGNDLSGWSFKGQKATESVFAGDLMRNVDFTDADFATSDLRGVDMRGAITDGARFSEASLTNAIRQDGSMHGLHLDEEDGHFVIRDYDGDPARSRPPIPIRVKDNFSMTTSSMTPYLTLIFDADPWDSLISFEPGVPVQLGGYLGLSFIETEHVISQVGRTFRIFDWTGVEPIGAFSVQSPYPWDVSELYTSGQVTLLLPGDTNGDQTVDLDDLNNVRNNFELTGAEVAGDTNGDQIVNLTDLNNVRNFFGVSTPQVVPESSGVALAGVGLLALAFAHATHFRVRGHQRIDLLNQDVKSYSTN